MATNWGQLINSIVNLDRAVNRLAESHRKVDVQISLTDKLQAAATPGAKVNVLGQFARGGVLPQGSQREVRGALAALQRHRKSAQNAREIRDRMQQSILQLRRQLAGMRGGPPGSRAHRARQQVAQHIYQQDQIRRVAHRRMIQDRMRMRQDIQRGTVAAQGGLRAIEQEAKQDRRDRAFQALVSTMTTTWKGLSAIVGQSYINLHKFAGFSAGGARAMATEQIGDLLRMVRISRATASGMQDVADASQRFKNALEPATIALINVVNRLGARVLGLGAAGLEGGWRGGLVLPDLVIRGLDVIKNIPMIGDFFKGGAGQGIERFIRGFMGDFQRELRQVLQNQRPRDNILADIRASLFNLAGWHVNPFMFPGGFPGAFPGMPLGGMGGRRRRPFLRGRNAGNLGGLAGLLRGVPGGRGIVNFAQQMMRGGPMANAAGNVLGPLFGVLGMPGIAGFLGGGAAGAARRGAARGLFRRFFGPRIQPNPPAVRRPAPLARGRRPAPPDIRRPDLFGNRENPAARNRRVAEWMRMHPDILDALLKNRPDIYSEFNADPIIGPILEEARKRVGIPQPWENNPNAPPFDPLAPIPQVPAPAPKKRSMLGPVTMALPESGKAELASVELSTIRRQLMAFAETGLPVNNPTPNWNYVGWYASSAPAGIVLSMPSGQPRFSGSLGNA